MGQEGLSMRKIREILRLKFACGLSNRQIAQAAGCGASTVFDYLSRARTAEVSWPLCEALDDEGALEELLFGAGRSGEPKRAAPDWPRYHEEMRKKFVTLALLWAEYTQEEPTGYGYSRFCQLYREWARRLSPTMRQIHRPGKKMFVDFSGGTIPIIDRETGEVLRAALFVAVLGHSNLTYAEPTLSQDLPAWIGANVRALEYFGGVPEMAVPDNLKAGVSRACRYEPDINRTYAEFAEHYGLAVVPARAGKPRDKAKVEVGVQIVERWIIAALRHRTFRSLQELREAIRPLLDRLNARPMRRMGVSRRDLFEAEERAALRGLPACRYEMAEWKRAGVNIDYHVEFDHHYYSVHHSHIHAEVDVRATTATVEILRAGKRIASHVRSSERFKHTTLPEHMPASHRAHQEWTPSRLIEWAKKIGPSAAEVVEEIMRRRPHPEQGYRSCLGILRLSKRYGPERLEAACARAAAFRGYSYRSVESILKAGLDAVAPRRREDRGLPRHENIRGSGYYN